jgi:Protein of unknown function (DUF3489)
LHFLGTGVIDVITAATGRRKQQWQPLRSIPKTTSRCTPGFIPPTPPNLNRSLTRRNSRKLTADWPASRLVHTWKSIASVAPFDQLKPVKKFTDRKAVVARIWAAIQRLSPGSAPQASEVAPAREESKKSSTQPANRARAKQGAKAAEERTNKKAEVQAMMKRAKGVTLAEIIEATRWQKHTVRGFVSILGSEGGEKIESSRSAGERTYRIAK